MPVACVCELSKLYRTVMPGIFRSSNLLMAVELAVEIRRPNRMNGPTMDMPRFSMTMIRFRMNVNQRSREHPERYPQ